MDTKKTKAIIREELKKLSGLSWGERLGYIWDYYKPLMAAILLIIFLVSMGVEIYQNLQKEQLLDVYFVNSNNLFVDSEAMTSEFTEYIGGLEKNQEINIDTTLSLEEGNLNQFSTASQTKITALASSKAIDVLVMDEETFDKYYAEGFFADLGALLSEEQLEAWSDLLIYREPVTEEEPYEQLELSSETELSTGDEKGVQEQKSLDAQPESDTGVVAAIDLTDAPALQKYEVYSDKKVYGGIFVNSEYRELFGQFFEFLLQ